MGWEGLRLVLVLIFELVVGAVVGEKGGAMVTSSIRLGLSGLKVDAFAAGVTGGLCKGVGVVGR